MAKSDIKNQAEQQRVEMSDPVLLMLGIGKQLWKSEPGDSFVERLRSEDAHQSKADADSSRGGDCPLTPVELRTDGRFNPPNILERVEQSL
jgi:hypothetical protein